MGRSPKVSSTQKSPRSIFDILRFTIFKRVTLLDEHPHFAVIWRPEELRAYHDWLMHRP
jgi:hypothetical protein